MPVKNIHYWGRESNRGDESRVEGTISVKELKTLYELKNNQTKADVDDESDECLDTLDDSYEDAIEESDDYFIVQAIMEDLSEDDFKKVVAGESGFVVAEETWFGIGSTMTKAKVGFAEGEY